MTDRKYTPEEVAHAKLARRTLLADSEWSAAFYGTKGHEAQRLAQREWAAWGDVVNGHLKTAEE